MCAAPPSSAATGAPLAFERGVVEVAGCEIRWSAHGAGEPATVLVHGGGANDAWWEDLVPLLATSRRIVTMDLSGHGDSGRRASYSPALWGQEILAVIRAAASGHAVVVGHSTGGRMSIVAAAHGPEAVRALVLVDSGVPLQLRDDIPRPRPAPVFETLEGAVRAFRLLPAQEPAPDPALVERLARRSVTERDGGWTWKADPAVYQGLLGSDPEQAIPDVGCPIALVQCERSDVTDVDLAREFTRRLGREVPVLLIPGANHHVMLEAPATLATLLDWLPETRPRPSGA